MFINWKQSENRACLTGRQVPERSECNEKLKENQCERGLVDDRKDEPDKSTSKCFEALSNRVKGVTSFENR